MTKIWSEFRMCHKDMLTPSSFTSSDFTPSSRARAFDVIGLTLKERSVVQAISKMAMTVSMISRHTKIPRTSILYVLKKLKNRQLVYEVRYRKQVLWRSNLHKPLQQLRSLGHGLLKIGTDYKFSNIGLMLYRGTPAIMSLFDRLIRTTKESRDIKWLAIQSDHSLSARLKAIGKSYDNFIRESSVTCNKINLEQVLSIQSEIHFVDHSIFVFNWKEETAFESRL